MGESDGKAIKKAILLAVQAEYELNWKRTVAQYSEPGSEPHEQPSISDEHRDQWIRFMEFLGMLYVNGQAKELALLEVLSRFQQLRGYPDDNLVEGVCHLLLTEGVVQKLLSSEKGKLFLSKDWQRGRGRLSDFAKEKTRYSRVKPDFEAIFELMEHGGKHPRASPKKSPKQAPAEPESIREAMKGRGKGKQGQGGSPKESSKRTEAVDQHRGRFDALGEDDEAGDAAEDGGKRAGGKGDKGKGATSKSGDKSTTASAHAPDPKQVFVAGIGATSEGDIRTFFQTVGEVDRVKVLRTVEGESRDACFITFRTEEQAVKAVGLHGASLGGRSLTVRVAHGGKGAQEKGASGFNGGGGGKGAAYEAGKDTRQGSGVGGSGLPAPGSPGPPDLGGAARFSSLSGGAPSAQGRAGGKGRGVKGNKGKTEWMSEIDAILEEALAEEEGPVRPSDFDFTAKRFLSELRSRDKVDGGERFAGAIEHILTYTSSKDRDSVRKWSAYVFTLLSKYDPALSEEFKKRDEERRRERASNPDQDRDLATARGLASNVEGTEE
jgi:hypothetical protein